MAAQILDFLRWILPLGVKVWLCVLIFYRRLHRRFPFFFVYFILNTVHGVMWWMVSWRFGKSSWPAYYYFWIAQGMVTAARGLAIAEICNRFLRAYLGIRSLAWRLLASAAALVILYAGIATASKPYHLSGFILAGDRGLELAYAVTLLALLGLSVYYEIRVPRFELLVASGFAFYSLCKVISDTIGLFWFKQSTIYSLIQEISYNIVVITWLWELRHPLPAEGPAPVLLDRSVYGEVVPQVNLRLERLNERLMKLVKPPPEGG